MIGPESSKIAHSQDLTPLPRQPRPRRDSALHQPQSLARRGGQRTQPAAYVIFHDATLAAIAESAPQSLGDLQGISGLGVKKLEAYGAQVLRVCNGAA
jgi:superfamily II DNA helicase RecQ